MKGLIFNKNREIEVREVNEPRICSKCEVKIEIKYSGICGTDLQVLKGNLECKSDIIRGHEAVGIVTEVGANVKNVKVNDRVVIDPNQYCGKCFYCRNDQTNFCEGDNGKLAVAGMNKDGLFAKYFICDETFVYKIPDDLSLEAAVLVEPLACVLHNIKAANIQPEDSVLVIGSGPMGMLCQLICKRIAGLTVSIEKNDFRKKFSQRFVDYAYYPGELTIEKVKKINEGKKFDVIIDAVGNQMEMCEAMIEKEGRIVILGIDTSYNFKFNPAHYQNNGIRIIGAGEYNLMFEKAIKCATKLENLEELVTKIYTIEKSKEAFKELLSGDIESMKTVFEF
ncbi:zinc-dependent alcohol dehydrogenase [Clostridium saccharoperbutylacetonicum]|uniref:zinc-dependent alcohol dehydrogenase n=1 Tax=Clostridium saccharoperbutylacetonicum TaxID=36745 RepID=UPI00098407E3|nr:alcohol dehydrogenase catalytic domain-containing protein [Clostridium saccharoperbutylacetonicum]AQR94668.1 sorbitol dehydrogenase [Clostridium saccharoperbutylacetonicum]NSB30509.1 2-desacetyl-2-hydroxyethyl bacteriochlorophyllide A dehydrogenase [Clostridium saccharoperbutylacetonicum]